MDTLNPKSVSDPAIAATIKRFINSDKYRMTVHPEPGLS